MLDLVRTLDKDKFESVVLSFTDGPMVEKMKRDGITTYVVPTEKPFDARVWGKVKEILKKEAIDILHAHGTRANSNTFYAARSLHIPLLYTVHGWSFHNDQHPIVKKVRAMSERFLVKNATKTICVSENNYKDAAALFNMQNAIVIKNGIDLGKFNPDRQFRDIRSELGLQQDAIVVGYIARITAQKDPFTFLRALAKIPADLNVQFLIVGDGDCKQAMLQLADELGITSRIVFENFREDLPDILHAIDIFCLPSLWEGLSLALLEAMAMRKAVIATAIDGTMEVITDKKNGLLFPVGNADQLGDALLLLINNKTLRDSLGAAAAATVREKFNLERMVKQVGLVYTELAEDVISSLHG